MAPEGVQALKEALRVAESSLGSIGDELWELLRGAWLSPVSANKIRQVAGWAGQQGPEVDRRLLILERMELDQPELFGGGKPVFVDESLFAPGAALPLTGSFWDRTSQQLQAAFDPDLNSGNPMTEQVKGTVEGLAGLGEMVAKLSPNRMLFDHLGWERDINDLAQAVVSGVQDPVGFAKAAADWDTWASNPDRAFGRLIPDIVAAITSAGASGVLSGGKRAVGALGKAAKNVVRPKPTTALEPHNLTRHLDRNGDHIPDGDGPIDASRSMPTVPAANPLDDAVRHTSNAEGRAWARDNMPLPALTHEELRALDFYGGIGYKRINPALREKDADPGVVWSPEVADEIAAMDQAIGKSHLPSDMVLHRGVEEKFLEWLGVDIKSPDEMKRLRGRVITEPGYLSTSVGRRAGFDGDLRVMLRAPKGHEALNMYPITKLIGEREILLRRGTSYIVRGVYRKDGHWYMEADVVPEGWTKPPDWDAPPSMDADLGWKGPYDD
ncbi:ADP-ribosyltransferase [Nonomuraea cavernae]|uniref:ADP-ribosyltransferase n=1 Tax=Nonomuraea cavernae TaxID=2045107 RepID=UPI003405DE1F